jgi:hypothetical protein
MMLEDSILMSEKIFVEDEARSQLHPAREWDEVLVTVRLIPGFESFLRPAPCSSLLRHLPLCGPIVVINLAEEQCDAIALLAKLEELIRIPLPGFSLNKPNQYRSQLNAHVRSHGLRVREEQGAEDKLLGRSLRPYRREEKERKGALSVLRSLWVEVVKPVLDALGYVSLLLGSVFSDSTRAFRERIRRGRSNLGYGGALPTPPRRRDL